MGLDGVAPCGVRVELADVFRQLVEVFDGHPRCSSKVCLDGRFSFVDRKEFCDEGRGGFGLWLFASFAVYEFLDMGLCSAQQW